MALINAGGYGAGPPSHITLPLNGRPWADLQLAVRYADLPWKAGEQVDVQVAGGTVWRMTVERTGPQGGFARVRLYGGTGGLGQSISAKQYRDIAASTVCRELLEECGEHVGSINLPRELPQWVRPAGPAHEALRSLMMRYPTHVWQMAPDGKVHVGVPEWREAEKPLDIEKEDAAAGTYTGPLTPALLPATRLTLTRGEEQFAKRVTRVTHSMECTYSYPQSQTKLRTTVGTGDGQDKGVSGLEAVARRALHWVDYLALYDCEVIRDHGNHMLDLRPLHPDLPPLERVRLVQPFPGAKVKLKAGGVVLLSFQGGDPSRPLATLHGQTELELLEVVTGRGQVLRLDDDRGEKSPEDARYERPHVLLQDAAGQRVELWAENGKERVTVRDKAGQKVELDPVQGEVAVKANAKVKAEAGTEVLVEAAQTVNIKGGSTVNIEAATVNVKGGQVVLAGGGPAVARVGDKVQVAVTSGSSIGTYTGTIISGSPKVVSG